MKQDSWPERFPELGEVLSGITVTLYSTKPTICSIGKELKLTEERHYAVRLLWVHDPDGFAAYQDMARPILARHGVHIERWLMTEDMDGPGMEKPDQIVVTWHKSAAAKQAFEDDPEFRKAKEIRDKAVRLVTITGKSVFGD